ncbi:MAG: NAD(P)H-hydrate dehydratase [Clostridia bacterium]|nr:NAD(P)H-hydrate dehydratase [Clostridia bacterium]
MLEVVTPKEMRSAEQALFEEGVPSLLVMESAVRSIYERMRESLGSMIGKKVLIAAGPGNNGGDGLALARFLAADHANVSVLLPKHPKTKEAQANLAYCQTLLIRIFAPGADDAEEIDPVCFDRAFADDYDYVVDALFGTGLDRKLTGIYAKCAQRINQMSNRAAILSIDIPSGLNGESGQVNGGEHTGVCICANKTYVLGKPKNGLLQISSVRYTGKLIHCPFEPISGRRITKEQTEVWQLEEADHIHWIEERRRSFHKGNAGRVLIYAGSMGMAGAAAMAARAALRAGAGLVTLAASAGLIPILQTLVPNAMCAELESAVQNPPKHDVFVAGCGIGTDEESLRRLNLLLANETGPVILDADALNIIAKDKIKLPDHTILTPHIGEAARLLKTDVNAVMLDPIQAAQTILAEYHAHTVVLKSHYTYIVQSGKVYICTSGCPALAKGGSGDALCGVMAALTAEKNASEQADAYKGEQWLSEYAAAACLWLGLAGEEAQSQWGDRGALTGDVIDRLPFVLSRLRERYGRADIVR